MTTKSESKNHINGVMVGEAELNNLGAAPSLKVKYALLNVDSGERFGAGTRTVWSERTVEKLNELIALMEHDIIVDIFEGGPVVGDVVGSGALDPEGPQGL